MKADMTEEQFRAMVIELTRHFEGQPLDGFVFPGKGEVPLRPDEADEAMRSLSGRKVTLARALEHSEAIPRKPGQRGSSVAHLGPAGYEEQTLTDVRGHQC